MQLARRYADFGRADTRIVAISSDPVARSRALAKRLKLPFPVLSDPKLRAIRAYGVRQKGRSIATPAVFVIRRDGQVAWRYTSGSIGDRPTVDAILREAKKVQHRH